MNLVECEECAAMCGSSAPVSLGDIRVIETVGEWQTVEKDTGVVTRHRTDLGGIVARYRKLESRVPCSMCGGHPHETGVIVSTFCGKTLALGFVCGLRDIIGFETVQARLKEEERYTRNMVSYRAFCATFPRRRNRVRALLAARATLCSHLRTWLPSVHRALTRRFQQGAAGKLISIDGGTREMEGTKVRRDQDGNISLVAVTEVVDMGQTHQLTGLELFGAHPSSTFSAAQGALWERIPRTAVESRRVERAIRKTTLELERAERFIESTANFLSLSNLRLALIAANEHDGAQVEPIPGGAIVTLKRQRVELWQPDFGVQKEAA